MCSFQAESPGKPGGFFLVCLNDFILKKFVTMKNNNKKPGFLTDTEGNKSSTRLKTFLAAITAFIIALTSVFLKGISIGQSLPIIITLLTYSAGEKSYQNFLESKSRDHFQPQP